MMETRLQAGRKKEDEKNRSRHGWCRRNRHRGLQEARRRRPLRRRHYAIPGTEAPWQQSMASAGLNGSTSALAFGDVTDFEAMADMVKKIEHDHGPVDILINCAGITRDATFRKMTP